MRDRVAGTTAAHRQFPIGAHSGNYRVETLTVFNICGNEYRLISVIKYRWQIVYIRQILTRVDYGKGRWEL